MGRLTQTAALMLAIVAIGCGGGPPPGSAPTAATFPPEASNPAAAPAPIGPPAPDPPPTGTSAPATAATPPAVAQVWRQLTDFPVESAFEVTSVVAVDGGFVAVGFEPLPGEDFFGRRQGVVWRSDDGQSWQRLAEPAFQFVTPEKIVALGDSLYVFGRLATCRQVIEDDCTDVPEGGNAVWQSTAGGAWERLPQLASMQHGLIDDVVAGPTGLAAFGAAGDENQTTTVWLSSDGASWMEVTDLAGMDPVSAMAATDTGLIAFGTTYLADIEDIEGRAAISTDGVTFVAASAPPLPGAAVEDVGRGAAGFVGVGYRGTVVEDLSAVALHSVDGSSWVQSTDADGSFAGSGLLSVHGLGNGYLGIGFTPEDVDFTSLIGQSWFSADGQGWRALAAIGGPISQLNASALGATGAIVFTADQEELENEAVSSTVQVWFAPLEALTG